MLQVIVVDDIIFLFIKCHDLNFVCSEAPCCCDICSFNKLKELERTLPPGLPMPYFSSWTTSQFSQTNIHHPAGAHLAPRTGYEPPYWHRPCYFGWQYVTSAAHVTHHAAFYQPENIPSTAYPYFSRYHATKYHDTGCHDTGYHATEDFANGYHDTATENRLGRELGGVAYDHGEFPKIVSVHSMAEKPKESSLSDPTDCHGNDNDESNNAHLGSPLTGMKSYSEDVTDTQKSTDHSISTILDFSCSSPVQNIKPLSETISLENNARVSLNSDEHELERRWQCSSAEDTNVKISNSALESLNHHEGLSSAALPEYNSESTVTGTESPKMSHEGTTELCPSAPPNIPPLKIRKNTLILHRVRKINKIQKRLKHVQSERKKARFLKKIVILQKEIELLTNGSPQHEQRSTGKEESPFTASPVKTSFLAPNKDRKERENMVDAGFTTIQDFPEEFKVDTSMGEYLSSEQPKGEMSGNGFRMNLFEKLGFWSEEDSSCEVSTSSDSSPEGSSDSQNSEVVNEPVGEALNNVFERKDELNALRFHSERSADSEDSQPEEFNENLDILVKSADSNYEHMLEYETAGNLCSPLEKPSKVYNESREVLKRKQLNIALNSLSAKRRCKTLPRKVVWKYDPRPLLFDQGRQKMQEIDATKQQYVSVKTEESCTAQNSAGKPFAANLDVTNDVNRPCLSIKPDTDSSASDKSEGFWVDDEDVLQRKLEVRESKISDLLRKQEGLLQTIEKMATKTLPRE
ncbi:hypothetical protein ACROYT_G027631 [Oculina patagonica]